MIGIEAIRAAREVLRGVATTSPMEPSDALTRISGAQTFLKCENLQRTGSFKIRGAYVRMSRLTAAEKARGVVAASAGNHAQGVALAADLLGIEATVFMPTGAPLPKLAATKAYGAHVELVGQTLGDALVAAQDFAERTGAVFIHPFDHPDLIAGQGTAGLELVEQCPDVRTVLVSAGGAGLLSGIAVAVKALRPDVQVIGVQAEGAAALPPSLLAGVPTSLPAMSTMADGIAVPRPADITFTHVQRLVDDVLTVSEDALSQALLLCLERAKMVVEPAGAAAVAALMSFPGRFEGPVVAVLSGGNIDPVLLMRVVQHGMISAGRYLSLRVHVPDAPGSLAALLSLLADHGANVLDVAHSRTDAGLHLGEVEVDLSLETKGKQHAEALLLVLSTAGYRLLTT